MTLRETHDPAPYSEFLNWLSTPVDEFPEANEPEDEDIDALLVELKRRGRETRRKLSPDVDAKSSDNSTADTLADCHALPHKRSEIEWAHTLFECLISSYLARPLSDEFFDNLTAATERWFVPRGASKWRWGADRRSTVDLTLREVDKGFEAHSLASGKGARLSYSVKAKNQPLNAQPSFADAAATYEMWLHAINRQVKRATAGARLEDPRPLVVHRDIKPENIVLACERAGNESLLVLVDFGTVRPPSEEHWEVILQAGEEPPTADASSESVESLVRDVVERRYAMQRSLGKRRGRQKRSGLQRPTHRGRRVPDGAAPPAPAAVLLVDGSGVADWLRPTTGSDTLGMYLTLPNRLSPAKEHLPQVHDFWHSTLRACLRGEAIDRSAM
ncbi:hypothetical protein [Streptomyces sp. NPDC085665]|uniref:hypothetical protein n=1 Tax=Streptomyces sp. NPDC085665 TaxID=3365735 RepID=UPI0037D0E994